MNLTWVVALATTLPGGVAHAQWVSFRDDTGTRLTLTPFNDDPAGDPLVDEEEKDLVPVDINLDVWDDVIFMAECVGWSVLVHDISLPRAPNAYLRSQDGAILLSLTTRAAQAQVPAGYQVLIDRLEQGVAD